MRDDLLCQYEIEEASIQSAKVEVENFLTDMGYDKKAVLTSLMVIEDMSLYIKEVNDRERSKHTNVKSHKNVLIKAECAVLAGENINLVLCDNGKLIDMADIDRDIISLRSYIITLYISKKTRHVRNLMTMGNNRCSFEIPVANR